MAMTNRQGGWIYNRRGLTIVELMIAVAIIGVCVLTTIGSYRFIATSLQHSKSRTLATALGQAQIERLKNISYYNLLVTTSTFSDTRFNPTITYDQGNYPAETLVLGGLTF